MWRIYFASVLILTGSWFSTPVQAAIEKTTVVPCRSDNTECWPTAFAITPHGNIFYVERFTGDIRVYHPDTGEDTLWKTITHISTDGEQGVLGIALDPNWSEKKWVYVYYTRAEPLKNRITRWRKKTDGSFASDRLMTVPASSNHNGGVLQFGPDKKLYVTVGENYQPAEAQAQTSPLGKVLRLNKDGSIPSDNPFAGTVPWFSYGHRNMYGLTFDPLDPTPSTVEVWLPENGPECNDELNFVELSKNYGWGESEACPDTNNSGPDPVAPVYTWADTIAVTGAAFCDHCGLGSSYNGHIFVGAYNTGTIMNLTLDNDRTTITGTAEDIYNNGSGILGMTIGKNNRLYFSDSRGIYKLH